MNSYVTGTTIKTLREKQHMTQNELADLIGVSHKTISKWETAKGLPDITLLEPLAKALGISVCELLSGEYIVNGNVSANIVKSKLYVCPVCGNIIHSVGEALVSCCGISLPALEVEETDDAHTIEIERVENDYCITLPHEMRKHHYISFVAYATTDKFDMIKLYPEGNARVRFPVKGHGQIYYYCNKHGLFEKKV